jgi:hypothetical protein
VPAGSEAIPTHLARTGLHWFALELALVLLLFAGIVALWLPLRRRLAAAEPRFWAVAAESVIAIPWLAFPVLFALALAGAWGSALIAAQVVLAVAGFIGLWRWRRGGNRVREAVEMLRESPLNPMAIAAICLFVAWAWLMPFPGSYNGHHHLLFNLLSEMWATGSYPVLDESQVSYDNDILVWPASFAFSLGLFSAPWAAEIDWRPVVLLGGLFSLLSLHLLRLTSAELGQPRWYGSLAFLLIAFGYFGAVRSTGIGFDLLTPLLVLLFALHLIRWALRGKVDWLGILLVLAVAALIRGQVFLMLVAVLAIAVLSRTIRLDSLRRALPGVPRAAAAAFAVGLPVITWTTFLVIEYGSPVFPHQDQTAGSFGVLHLDELFGGGFSQQNHFLDHFLPLFPDEPGTMIKNAALGTSFSVLFTVVLVGYLVFAPRIHRNGGRTARRLALTMLAGFAVVLYLAFPTYPKYPHYGSLLLAPFAAIFLAWACRRLAWRGAASLVGFALLACGTAFWAINTWGHATWDESLENVKLLNPGYEEPVDRLARSTSRTRESLTDEIEEYTAALSSLEPGERILYAEHEPGALIPSLVDREFLGDALFLEGSRATSVVAAESNRELEKSLRDLGIRFVYRPQRAHTLIEDSLVWKRIQRSEEADYLIPAEALLESRS